MLNSWVVAPTEQEIDYRLTRNGTVISAGKRKVTAGLSRLLFRDRAGSAGTIEYRLTVQGQGEDPVPENNSARSLVGIDGPKPILLVSGSGSDSGPCAHTYHLIRDDSFIALVLRIPPEITALDRFHILLQSADEVSAMGLLLIIEILERRTGLVSWRRKRRKTLGRSSDGEAVPSSARPRQG